MTKLLSRSEFNHEVFERDHYLCRVCKKQALAAHHIIDRSLFEDGGYRLENGISLCNSCHWQAELTHISCQEFYKILGVVPTLPSGWEDSENYDKWGNIILENGKRIAGPLFDSEQFQKIMRIGNLHELFYY